MLHVISAKIHIGADLGGEGGFGVYVNELNMHAEDHFSKRIKVHTTQTKASFAYQFFCRQHHSDLLKLCKPKITKIITKCPRPSNFRQLQAVHVISVL